jgi:flagellar motility protein MotE (MotC chaperone)
MYSKRTVFLVVAGSLIVLKLGFSASSIPIVLAIDGRAHASSSEPEADPAAADEPAPTLIDKNSINVSQCEAPEVLLQSIQRERLVLDNQHLQLGDRRAEIALASAKLEIDKKSLLELKESLESLLETVETAKTKDLEHLVGIYTSMKPADAARIIDDLDIEVTILMLTSMKTRDAAPILARMSEVRARAISKIILEKSKLPGDQNLQSVRLE